MYKNYVFDLYGTLIDINTNEWSMNLWKKLAILYSYKQAHYTPKELKKAYGEYVEQEKKSVGRRHREYTVIDIKIEKVFKKLFNAKGVKCTKRDIEEICTAFRCYSTSYIKLYDGVIDLLETLKSKGKKIYLLSNAQRKFTENELNMFGLIPYFDGIIISSDEECSKPDPHYYNILLDRYSLDPNETIMVGNDYISDIQGSKDVGLDSLYIHQSISPEIKGELVADYKVMDGNVYKIKELIVK
ncbi:MAG: HAD family hydrolase [Oscillospiraceae bacterium]|nr:HAD family hydrolase [Oscillospiraceae bacterium]